MLAQTRSCFPKGMSSCIQTLKSRAVTLGLSVYDKPGQLEVAGAFDHA